MAVTDSLDKLVNGGFSFAQAQKGGVKEIKGKPLEIPLDHIEPDPEQPRKQFSEASLNEMRDSIKQYGVKTPISVREKPGAHGRYIINFGERRWRGSRLADKRLIPAFIDNEFDPYVAVVENIEREELAPLDLAKWIQGRVDAGDKKGAIAKKLSKDASYVTIHLALLGLPAPVQQLHDKGLCTDARALYDLRKLYEQDAERVSTFGRLTAIS